MDEGVVLVTPDQLRRLVSEEFKKVVVDLLPQQHAVKKEYLTSAEVEEIFGISVSVLESDRVKKQGIPYHKKGRLVLYKIDDVRKYLEMNKVQVHF